MKKTIKYFSIAALALVGTVMTSCSSSDDLGDNTQQPQQVSDVHNVETLTATVSMNAGTTRALTSEGVKTFAEGDKIAVIYTDIITGNMTKAESVALTAADIDGQNASFTVTLTDPDKTKSVNYIYPANMAKSDGSINFEALATQDGTLETLAQNLDYCFYTGAWVGGALPTGELENKLAICAFDIKDATGTNTITNTITRLVVNDGANSYTITRSATEGPIYVAINPTSGANIDYFATDGTKYYARLATDKTYKEGKLYPIGLRMPEVIRGKFSVSSTKQVYFSKSNLQAKALTTNTWQWHFADNQYARVGGKNTDESGTETLTGNNYINGNGIVTSDGVGKNVDLFGWSTTDTHLGIHKSKTNTDYRTGSVTNGSDFVDWGSASEVTACIGTGWRTLTGGEWDYLMNTRSGNRYAKAQINGSRSGFIILPDGWTNTTPHTLSNINNANSAFNSNVISSSDWTDKYEKYGAVFLPVTGQRSGTSVKNQDLELHYWSSTGGVNANSVPIANHLRFTDGLAPNTGAGRCNGYAVRLVRNVR